MTYDEREKTAEIMTKIEPLVHIKKSFFFQFADAIMDVDSFASFDVMFLGKKACNAIAISKKGIYYVTLI